MFDLIMVCVFVVLFVWLFRKTHLTLTLRDERSFELESK